MEFEAFDFLTGIGVTLLAAKLFALSKCRRYLQSLLRLSDTAPMARQLTMQHLTIPADWIKSGAPVFTTCSYAETPDRRSSSGIWRCDGPSTFEWRFGSDESVYVLDGTVEIEYRGQQFVLEAGGSAFFYANTRAVWHVPQHVRKSYMVHYPSNTVRWARRWLGRVGRA